MKRKIIIMGTVLIVLTSCTPYIYTAYMSGDCIDRVIIIRQELRAQGYEADIVLGRVKYGDKIEGHAWVKYKDKKTGEWIRIDNY